MMDLTWDMVLAAIFLVLGVVFRKGLLTDWVLGTDPKVRGRFNEKAAMRFFSNLMFVMVGCNLVTVAGGLLKSQAVSMVGVVLCMAALAGGIVYFMKSKKFRRD